MIVPMKKYAFLIHHRDYHNFLIDLQELGVVDIVDKGIEPDEETTNEILRLQQYDRVIKFLKSKESSQQKEFSGQNAEELLDKILQMQSETESLKQKIATLDKTYRSVAPWGKFSSNDLKRLADNGFYVRFFEVTERKFRPEWEKEYNLQVISQSEGMVYFVIVQREGEIIEIDAEEIKAPERPADEIQKEKEQLLKRINEIENFYSENAAGLIPLFEQERNQKENKISFARVVRNTDKEAADHLMIIEGWVPDSKTMAVNSFLDKKEVFYLIDNPGKEDKVPIMLKNNNFSKLFEPIGKLYSLPNYRELDLTPFFAPFFMLFFGFCLGDSGYGLLFVIGAMLFRKKVSSELRPILTLMLWLGLATIIFGAVSGTFFGMNLIEMIDEGKLLWLRNVRAYMLDSEKMFYFALILGAIQIVYGMFIKAINLSRQYGLAHALSTIGWIILILGLVIVFALKNDNNVSLMNVVMYVIFAISGVLILFFNNPGKNIFVNFGGGIWEVYSIVTGVLGDLLSYIRLFALGVSSAILGYVFNDLAVQMSGSTPIVSQLIFIIILLIGHGLNIFMATLGAFVHPMRLTFVEFYKNAGFTGGGKAYHPFSRK